MKIQYTTVDSENFWISEFCGEGFTSVQEKRRAIDLKPNQVETIVAWIQESKADTYETRGEQIRSIRLVSDETEIVIPVAKAA